MTLTLTLDLTHPDPCGFPAILNQAPGIESIYAVGNFDQRGKGRGMDRGRMKKRKQPDIQ